MRWQALVATGLMLAGCRDEQAGPRADRPGGPTGAQQPGQPPPPQQRPPPGQPLPVLDAAPGDLTWKSGATWLSGALVYVGSKLEPANPQPGQQVRVHHYFQTTKPVPPGYKFFMHAIDADTGAMLGNLDHEFQGGASPLGTWPVGKVVEDMHGLQMPAYPGTVQLVMGFWNEQGRLTPDVPAMATDGRVFGPKLAPAKAPDLPEYKMAHADKPPTIDGKLDDEVWKHAVPVELHASMDGSPVTRKTVLRMLWDEKNIYVAFDNVDPDVWGTLFKKDDAIYNEDACEVFFDADGDGKTYNELQVSPHNTQFDAAFVARRSDLETAKKWESGMTTAVQVNGTLDDDKPDVGWTAEMQIPIANLMAVPHVPPLKGDRWRFNAYRLEHLKRLTQIEGQSFSPLFVGDFHALPRFGWLSFE